MRLALGAAQFGLNYGIANKGGQLDLDEGRRIISLANSIGIDTLDTAIAYGESERALGQIGVDGWAVITKLPPVPEYCDDVVGWVHLQIEGSLKKLGVRQLHGVLLHRPAQLFGHQGERLLAGMQSLVSQGLVQKIGVSIYEPTELDQLFAYGHFGLVQAPLNVLDRRLLESGWVRRLEERGVELHTRSVFLQGLLLMRPDLRPVWFRRWHALWTSWERWLNEQRLSPLEACLRFVLSVPEVNRVVVGVDSVVHLREILESATGPCPDYATAPCTHDPILLNPAQWKLS